LGKAVRVRLGQFFFERSRLFSKDLNLLRFRGNIDQGELRSFKRIAKTKLAMSDRELADAIIAGELIEIEGAV
jgi:hypothetical protein